MAQQYQAYSKPTYDDSSAHGPLQIHSPPPPNYAHAPDSYPVHHPQQNMSNMTTQQPAEFYRAPQPMSEKPQLVAQTHSHEHGHSHVHGPKFGNKWTFGLFDCFSPLSTCCLSWWCSCFLFGKTYDREHGKGETSGCNGMCCAWYCAACLGFQSCLQCIVRTQQRERHGIEGSSEEKESIVRNTGIDPKTKVAYQPLPQGMEYPA
ncbi:hypothetical protein PMZ80_007661 [Knufia obscura]|uniref:PLAC8 family-domain-containing protein n=2 Tax=Knufia TaxID=430999 RepID=A0AAN8I9E0_9EURO|nr:hypothetical protein PMZ80_007661 [Knufia obscura]KAK5954200.1 hypothetical protein OHC33_004773 [Knufia fluminis]